MECAKVKQLLPEYVDQTLDAQTKVLVEEHLKICKGCSAELSALRTYLGQMRALKQVKAPEDFLQKVHARINRRFEFERIMRKLFLPAQIKIPLQLVTATVILLLVVSVLNVVQHSGMKLTSVKKDVDRIVVADKRAAIEAPIEMVQEPISSTESIQLAKENKLALGRDKEIDFQDYDLGTRGFVAIKDEKPIELALNIKHAADVSGWGGVREDSARQKKEAAWDDTEKMVAEEETKDFGDYVKAPAASASLAKTAPLLPEPNLNQVLLEIKELIKIVEGEVFSIEYQEGTNLPQFVNAQIPVKNFTPFLEQLDKLGELQGPQKPLPPIAVQGPGHIPIRIRLTPTQ